MRKGAHAQFKQIQIEVLTSQTKSVDNKWQTPLAAEKVQLKNNLQFNLLARC